MPASRCLVQDCDNVGGPGISIHKSPADRKIRLKWVNFIEPIFSLHRNINLLSAQSILHLIPFTKHLQFWEVQGD